MKMAQNPDLFIVGLGVLVPAHVTIEASEALSVCTQIFSIVQEPPETWLPKGVGESRRFINLLHFYEERALRMSNYDRVSEIVIGELKPGTPSAYVTYGNPLVFDRVTQNLVEAGKQRGLTIRITPGISSLDTVLCSLRTGLAPGIQIYDASSLLVQSIEPNLTIPLLLLQIGAFGSLRTCYRTRQDGGSLMELQNYLLGFYPENHAVSFVRTGQFSESDVTPTTMGQLFKASAEVISGSSLYIPPSRVPSMNLEFLARMEGS